jgi:biopolymer transport protein TolQ
MNDFSVIDLFLQASLIVQAVMVILIIISILSWIVIFERHFNLNRIKVSNQSFEERFWSGADLSSLHEDIKDLERIEIVGSLRVFKHGFNEYLRLNDEQKISIEDLEIELDQMYTPKVILAS